MKDFNSNFWLLFQKRLEILAVFFKELLNYLRTVPPLLKMKGDNEDTRTKEM